MSNKLSSANKIYKDLKETYYSHPTISKLVEPTLRKVPKNINSVVSEISKPMERIRQAHPELVNELNKSEAKENAIKLLKNVGRYGGAGAAAGAVGEGIILLKHLLENK